MIVSTLVVHGVRVSVWSVWSGGSLLVVIPLIISLIVVLIIVIIVAVVCYIRSLFTRHRSTHLQ